MALVLSSVVIVLVSTTFLVQTRHYQSQRLHAGAQDNARVATERVATEIRAAKGGGIRVAGARTLTLRSPIVVGMICDRQGNDINVHFEGGVASLDSDEVAGMAVRDTLSGAWDYQAATWSGLDGGGATAAGACEGEGADTTGASAEFRTFAEIQTLFTPLPNLGTAVMLYREATFKVLDSELEPGSLGLFQRVNGGSFVEFATGMDATARFQYRTEGGTYADTVVDGSLDDIDAIRIVADARKPAVTGGQDDVTFGWSVTVPLRNTP